jgi:hypothetical protein
MSGKLLSPTAFSSGIQLPERFVRKAVMTSELVWAIPRREKSVSLATNKKKFAGSIPKTNPTTIRFIPVPQEKIISRNI